VAASEAEGEVKKRVSGTMAGAARGAAAAGLACPAGPAAGTAEGVCQGLRLWGNVARWVDKGALGAYKGPFWPQALKTAALPARTSGVT